jgi:hypothetical protein
VVSDPEARYFGVKLTERTLLPGDAAAIGATSCDDWLGAQATRVVVPALAKGERDAEVSRMGDSNSVRATL